MCEVNAKMFHADICVHFRACMMIGTETGFAVSAHIRIILHSLARLVSELIFATCLTGQMTKKLFFWITFILIFYHILSDEDEKTIRQT